MPYAGNEDTDGKGKQKEKLPNTVLCRGSPKCGESASEERVEEDLSCADLLRLPGICGYGCAYREPSGNEDRRMASLCRYLYDLRDDLLYH